MTDQTVRENRDKLAEWLWRKHWYWRDGHPVGDWAHVTEYVKEHFRELADEAMELTQ